jgi:hypothetical protein
MKLINDSSPTIAVYGRITAYPAVSLASENVRF